LTYTTLPVILQVNLGNRIVRYHLDRMRSEVQTSQISASESAPCLLKSMENFYPREPASSEDRCPLIRRNPSPGLESDSRGTHEEINSPLSVIPDHEIR
jgi:hypothetical protein